jgi:hypothetical protein
MKPLVTILFAATVAIPATAQVSLTLNTSGTVPKVTAPNIQPCSVAPEPYYFAISGVVAGNLGPNEEIRLLVKPVLLNGGPIFGCEWIKQCHTATPDASGAITFFGQMGTNTQARSWFTGAQATVALAVLPVGAPVCIRDPFPIAISISNIATINLDPTIPNLFDFQIPCSGSVMDVQGTPTPGQGIAYTLPARGLVGIGLLDPNGFLVFGCQAYFNPVVPITAIATDAAGVLNLPIPNDPSLAGVDLSSQGILTGGPQGLDLTQPTLVQIR